MTSLCDLVANLPDRGARIEEGSYAGLALRLERSAELNSLSISRINALISAEETKAVADAIFQVFSPPFLFADRAPRPRLVHGRRHYIQRLYWHTQDVRLIRPRPGATPP